MTDVRPYPVDPSYTQLIKEPEYKSIPEDVSKYDIVKATQYGILSRCIEIIESGFDVNQMDSENVSLLHWASINNRQELVQYYHSQGANIDVIGGDLLSTPLHWAVRQGLLEMVALLLKLGANPLLGDGQGLSCIHVAAQLAYTHIVAYLLAKGVDVDSVDAHGMTALMWGAARSNSADPARLLITWGTNVSLQDINGRTAGHYAAMAGNFVVIGLLDRAGIDWLLINNDGCTVQQTLANKNMKWVAAKLNDMMIARGLQRHKNYFVDLVTSSKRLRTAAMVVMPPVAFTVLGLVLHFPLNYWLKLLCLILLLVFVRFGLRLFADDRTQLLSMFSLATATTLLICGSYLLLLLPFNTTAVNVAFIVSISLLWYNFLRACTRDPGYLDRNESRRINSILAMASNDPSSRVSLQRFCTTCLIRKPLRSKHCAVCDRCVAKFDHHCPWIYNCVGANTMGNFVMYLLALVPSLSLFSYGAFNYWLSVTTVAMVSTESTSLMIYRFLVDVCHVHPWLLFCTVNALIYLLWVTLLLIAQLYQAVWLNETTNERINWDRFFSPTPTSNMPGHPHGAGADQCCKGKQGPGPYNMGVRRNLLDLFQARSFRVDWTNVFTKEQFNTIVKGACEKV